MKSVLRSELRRLFRWLKDRNLTAVVTGERGEATLSRHGLEEYISDCVILLDHQVTETVLTRRLRVVKYRGSTHGMNEYPFLIEQRRHFRAAGDLDGSESCGVRRAGVDGRSRAGHDVRRQRLLSGQQHSGIRDRGNGQDQPDRAFCRRRLRPRRELYFLLI